MKGKWQTYLNRRLPTLGAIPRPGWEREWIELLRWSTTAGGTASHKLGSLLQPTRIWHTRPLWLGWRGGGLCCHWRGHPPARTNSRCHKEWGGKPPEGHNTYSQLPQNSAGLGWIIQHSPCPTFGTHRQTQEEDALRGITSEEEILTRATTSLTSKYIR